MKRTKENWLTSHPEDRQGISGLRFMDGEDLQYQSRQQQLRDTQRKWIEEQKQQKEAQRQQEEYEDRMYAQQTQQINRMRGMLEDDLKRKQRTMQESTRDANIQLMREKKEKERFERNTKIQDEHNDMAEQDRIRTNTQFSNPLY